MFLSIETYGPGDRMSAYQELIGLITAMDDESEMDRLFKELLTERELSDLVLRWELLKELHQGMTQRKIAAKHKISLCKITRGSKILKSEDSISRHLLEKAYGPGKNR